MGMKEPVDQDDLLNLVEATVRDLYAPRLQTNDEKIQVSIAPKLTGEFTVEELTTAATKSAKEFLQLLKDKIGGFEE